MLLVLRLHQLLNADDFTSSPRTKLPKLVVPGSHATIYPWGTPAGVPQDILEQMREDLLKILVKVARKSRPSSMQSSAGGSDPEDLGFGKDFLPRGGS